MSIVIVKPTLYEAPALSKNKEIEMEDDMEGLIGMSNGIDKIVLPGEFVTDDAQFMRGHGTVLDSAAVKDSAVVNASVMGTITRVNKLLSVRPLKARFVPEIGDLVIGRITAVDAKRWKVDIAAKQDAILQLASINLPGGIQRRKTGSDELQMRTFFEEGDLVVAEVQSYFQDGSVSLHTRSLKYGKLRNGQFLKIPSLLVRRGKQHSFTLGNPAVDLIIGTNGYCFVSKNIPTSSFVSSTNSITQEASEAIYSNVNESISMPVREEISRVRNVIEVLARHGHQLYGERVAAAVEASRISDVGQILDAELGQRIAIEAVFSGR